MKKSNYLLTILCFVAFSINAFAQQSFIKERTKAKSNSDNRTLFDEELQAAKENVAKLKSEVAKVNLNQPLLTLMETQELNDAIKKAEGKVTEIEQVINAQPRYNLLLSAYTKKVNAAKYVYEKTLNDAIGSSAETFADIKKDALTQLNEDEEKANKIYESAVGEFVDFRLSKHLFCPLSHKKFAPKKWRTTSRLVEYFFEDKITKYFTNIGENNTININPDGALSVYSEIATSYFPIGKIYIATQVSKSNASDATTKASEETIQNQLSGGGNMILGYQIPIVRGGFGDGLFTYGSFLTAIKTGLNVPAVNTSVADPSFSFEHGINAYLTLGNGNISFYGSGNLSFMWGDKKYRDVLNTTFGAKSFLLTQFNVGLNIANAYRIGVSIIPNFNDATSKFPTMTINTAFIPQ